VLAAAPSGCVDEGGVGVDEGGVGEVTTADGVPAVACAPVALADPSAPGVAALFAAGVVDGAELGAGPEVPLGAAAIAFVLPAAAPAVSSAAGGVALPPAPALVVVPVVSGGTGGMPVSAAAPAVAPVEVADVVVVAGVVAAGGIVVAEGD
jgi:hypothetical protein